MEANIASASSTIVGPGRHGGPERQRGAEQQPAEGGEDADDHRPAIVVRNERASCWAVATGTTISARHEQQADRAHRDGDGHGGEHGDQQVVDAHPQAGHPGEVGVAGDGEELGEQAERGHEQHHGQAER